MLLKNTAAGGLFVSGDTARGAGGLFNEACATNSRAQVRAYWGRN
jgi:hypothetical protein